MYVCMYGQLKINIVEGVILVIINYDLKILCQRNLLGFKDK